MKKTITLEELAHQTMLEKGFLPEFPACVTDELEKIHSPALATMLHRDMRNSMWVSIDNETSLDLDQLTFAENGKIFIAVADVDALVKKGSAIDTQALHNTTSVYTPTQIFPMLPLKLSTNLTSLNEKTDRCAIVIEVKVKENGEFDLSDIYPALVRNQAKLNYPTIGAWLEKKLSQNPLPKIPNLEEQLLLQDKIGQQIQQYRNAQGSLEFGEIKLEPILVGNTPVALEKRTKNRAHSLIENFMIAANVAATRYLKNRNLPSIRRVVKTPKRWNRIVELAKHLNETLPSRPDPKALRQFLLKQQQVNPSQFPDLSLAIIKLLGRGEYVLNIPGHSDQGHFDLAEHEYTHATAPNRRFPDLIMQRLLKNCIFQEKASYDKEELSNLAIHCTKKEDDASKVERQLLKCAAAIVLQKETGRIFNAMVTGSSQKGTWVRLDLPPIEGKLTKGFKNVDVGDYLKVKLIKVDVMNGHIDFARV